jgi:NADPH:quinone reductase-like Zn-dependent oxidoreductase
MKAELAQAVRREIWPMVEAGRIRPQIDRVIPLAQARQAHECMEASAHLGKIMLEVKADLS